LRRAVRAVVLQQSCGRRCDALRAVRAEFVPKVSRPRDEDERPAERARAWGCSTGRSQCGELW
ncbi:MAG: hypothetical protein KDC46_00295, partial [Thermoleophilia bacterium]|nr:hypothetical protein [Thermoleophilia bacterium]